MMVPTGLVIVDHGSRRAESNAMHEEFVAAFAARPDARDYVAVRAAHMELATPTVADAIADVVSAGARRVLVMPYFLFAGNHWERDIPAQVDEVAHSHPGVDFLVTAPVGLHPLMQEVVRERLEQCVHHAAGEADACALCAGTDRCRWASAPAPTARDRRG
jgi:sirohydrochlorin ferrochelatase